MIQKIYQKLQTKEGLMLVVSLAIIVGVIGFLFRGGFHGRKGFDGVGQPVPSIRVSGTGEMNVSPDIARFTFSISKDASTIADARNQIATIGNELIANLKAAGIDEKDIKTENMSTYPKYENRAAADKSCATDAAYEMSGISPRVICAPVYNSVVVGYTVSTTYSVKVRDLDKVSTIATLLTDAKLFSLNGPDFAVDDVEAVTDDAREKAIEDAKAQAKVLARQLGVKLGKIIDFQVDGGYSPMPMNYDRAMMSAAGMKEAAVSPELPTGETTIRSQVTITYRIK